MKVLIIDDEPNVREGLKRIIDWESLGFYICGEASNGSDGLNKIMKFNPELTLLDIKMPNMHGLELVSEARKQGYLGKIIILSGYSDFEYARDAINLGVDSYLLKPIDEDELIEAVKIQKTKIEKELKSSLLASKNNQNAINIAICNLILGKTYSEDKIYLPRDLGLKSNIDSFQVAVIEGWIMYDDIESIIFGHLSKDFIEKHIKIVTIENSGVVLFKGMEPSELLQRLEDFISSFDSTSVLIGVGRRVDKPDDICHSYLDAKNIINHKFFYNQNERILCSNVDEKMEAQVFSFENFKFEEYVEKLHRFVEAGETDKIENLFDALETSFSKMKIQPEKVKGIFSSLFIETQKDIKISYPLIELRVVSSTEIINKVYGMTYLFDVISYLKSVFIKMAEGVGNVYQHNVVSKILNYIDKNSSKDLKLESLADLFGYNSAYLGKLFKNSVGDSFNLYLEKKRINEAKALLLQPNLKVYQISEKVGYKNLDYFYKKFKRYVGESPNEYRRKVGIFLE